VFNFPEDKIATRPHVHNGVAPQDFLVLFLLPRATFKFYLVLTQGTSSWR
ncbi:hypothetical protein CEXT_336421, partial [Caerostris extrusa]